jgi:hypothetical protein
MKNGNADSLLRGQIDASGGCRRRDVPALELAKVNLL